MPKIDDKHPLIHPFLMQCGPKLEKHWRDNISERLINSPTRFYDFLIRKKSKEMFISDPGKDEEAYYSLIESMWKEFPKGLINTTETDDCTILMSTLLITKDPRIINLTIKNTSNKGINAQHPENTLLYGKKFALALSISAEHSEDTINMLIDRSDAKSLNESMSVVIANLAPYELKTLKVKRHSYPEETLRSMKARIEKRKYKFDHPITSWFKDVTQILKQGVTSAFSVQRSNSTVSSSKLKDHNTIVNKPVNKNPSYHQKSMPNGRTL